MKRYWKSPLVSDHGGRSYGTRPRRTKLVKEHIYSMRCLDCGALRFVLIHELERATAPRCLRCGGTLEETDVSRKRRIERSDAVKIATGEAGGAGPAESGVRCQGCGRKYRDRSYLAVHLTQDAACRGYCWDHGAVVVVRGLAVIQASLHLERRGTSNWHLRGVTRAGGLAEIIRHTTKQECEREIANATPRLGSRT